MELIISLDPHIPAIQAKHSYILKSLQSSYPLFLGRKLKVLQKKGKHSAEANVHVKLTSIA
jgi:hypothetical protein